LLKKDLQIFTFNDLLNHFPFRHIDKTKISNIIDINYQTDYIQVVGKLDFIDVVGEKSGRRLVGQLVDNTACLDLAWFQSIAYMQKTLQPGLRYLVFGKVAFFNGKPQMVHPEIEAFIETNGEKKSFLEPVYSTTEKLKARGLGARQIAKLTFQLFTQLQAKDIAENIPNNILEKLNFIERSKAYRAAHFPLSEAEYTQAIDRLKFEEFFVAQVRMGLVRLQRHNANKGVLFTKVGNCFNNFYSNNLPFALTNAQKRVLKEIRTDTAKGYQMNRLLQGDVGSGKTIVALLAMLIAADNGFQSCIMAPTEILAQQHYNGIKELLEGTNIEVSILTGSVKIKQRRIVLSALAEGKTTIIVGTHALIEDVVVFKNLGFVVVDEQHRFGVAQRAALWKKAIIPPHILVMTATPIPRTLAMTAFGDLDYSVMDELPPGRQPIKTVQRFENKRASVMDFVKEEVDAGRQAYFIYPLIEESEKLSYEDLMRGYEQVKSFFPDHKYNIAMLHGKMPSDQKESNMQKFVSGNCQIMVATTVIEVGVNVPNASVMVIESSEKFGLSQLHQLRGRVGRGSQKSYCILLCGSQVSFDGKKRLNIMCETNDGFKIAEKDLELRGPGDIEGTRQSGALDFKLASLVDDKAILEIAKQMSDTLLTEDFGLALDKNLPLKTFLNQQKGKTGWSKIS
jgi:ATP-dependent DNA helicase RecG